MLSKTEISTTELQEVAGRIKALRQMATKHAVEIGCELLRVKAILPHGIFMKWVENECEFKIRTAQDLMKLAREANDATLVALMVPSTLRLYLSKSTPPAVRQLVKSRLDSGERVSRNDLQSAISDAKGKPTKRAPAVTTKGGGSSSLLGAASVPTESEIDRSRKVANLFFKRLTIDDYEYVMKDMNWEVWNRVLVWLRVARLPPSGITKPTQLSALAHLPVEATT